MLRQYFGWSKSSKMPATYIHMSQSGMNNRYYLMYGKTEPEEHKPKMLEEPEICNKCGMQNPTGYRFCFRCNATLDRDELKLLEKETETKKTLNFITQDTELSQKFLQLIQEAKEKQNYVCSQTPS